MYEYTHINDAYIYVRVYTGSMTSAYIYMQIHRKCTRIYIYRYLVHVTHALASVPCLTSCFFLKLRLRARGIVLRVLVVHGARDLYRITDWSYRVGLCRW